MVNNKRWLGLATAAFVLNVPTLRADDAPVPAQIVDAMNKVFGIHAGFRANHAKGVVVEGHFEAAKGAASLSRASLFTGAVIPVTVRFSDSGGLPDIADGSGSANPHGMAIKCHLPAGGDTDMVINSLKFSPGHARRISRFIAGCRQQPGGR